MPELADREAGLCRLVTCDYADLLVQDPVEGVWVRSRGSGHERIMPTGSDKSRLRKCRNACEMPIYAAKILLRTRFGLPS